VFAPGKVFPLSPGAAAFDFGGVIIAVQGADKLTRSLPALADGGSYQSDSQ
jgi:hypothetical protein